MVLEVLDKFIDTIMIALKGKKLAVLGARGTGKSTLLHFLHNNELLIESRQTTLAKPVAENRFRLGDLQLDLKDTKDLPGGELAIRQWEKLHNESDYVIYLINASEPNSDGIVYDLKEVSEWQNKLENKPKLLIVVTHMDLNSEYCKLSDSDVGTFYDEYVKNMGSFLHPLSNDVNVCIGALNNHENACSLISDIIQELHNEL
ncbi:GTPase domain-containing protein [Pseudoalteromonas rhizosphaerae]|uniref:GTPase domain-containing protein n=1 Tax=Pseudoalteromonas rhizosphaerae TaxID=2518973 RepID=UPI001230A0CA|nr:GTPase domain-containing protein [Pseudoalteromonas rhizosphaerae]